MCRTLYCEKPSPRFWFWCREVFLSWSIDLDISQSKSSHGTGLVKTCSFTIWLSWINLCDQGSSHNIAPPLVFGNISVCMHGHCSIVCSTPSRLHINRVCTQWNLHLTDWFFCWDFNICASVGSPNFECLGGEIGWKEEAKSVLQQGLGIGRHIALWIATGSWTRNVRST